jgi:hypothetical protein
VSSDRIDPIDAARPGPVAPVSPVLLTPVEREAQRRRRERAREERRRREAATAPGESPPQAPPLGRLDLRG